jgi:hypothetical protein
MSLKFIKLNKNHTPYTPESHYYFFQIDTIKSNSGNMNWTGKVHG